MKTFLLACLLALVGCGGHGDDDQVLITKQGIPTGAVDLGQGRYLKFTSKDGREYAGVVFPLSTLSDRVEELKPGSHRSLAQALLVKHTASKWSDFKKEDKGGYRVFIFLRPTPEEEKEMDKIIEELREPLIPQ